MAEPLAEFVARRRPDWRALEQKLEALDQGKLDLSGLGELDRLYRRAAADLAVAQLHYAPTDVYRFLNGLNARAYGAIYRAPDDRWASLKRFFAVEFPATVREELAYFRVGAALTALGVVVGAVSVALVPGGADLLVDPNLRAMVDDQHLWTDLAASMAPSQLAIDIFTNNLAVTFQAFAFGLTFGVLTVLVLAWNGVHVGALVTYCFQHGLGPRLLVFMSAHGWVELSIIALCGGAGLMVGHALLDPGELPRGQALRERGRKAVRIVLGCAPFLVLTGVVEGFVSPGNVLPAPLKVALGPLLCAAFWLYLMRSGRFSSRAPRPTEG